MMPTDPTFVYQLDRTFQVLRDRPHTSKELYDLDFHLKQGDYFGMLAGALGFIVEDYPKKDARQYVDRLLRKMQHDLAALHKTHDIIPKHNTRE